MTDFEKIGERINKYIDFKNVNSKADYERAVAKVIKDTKFSESLLKYTDQLYSESEAKELVESNKAVIIEEKPVLTERAIRFEKTRGRSGVIDEKKTSKDSRLITPFNYRLWRNNPNRLDLKTIDTKRPKGKGFAVLKPKKIQVVSATPIRDRVKSRRNRGKSAKIPRK